MTVTNFTYEDDKLETICMWIRANVDKQIGWYELSKISDLSHTNLIRLFKKINTTPMSFVRRVKDEERLKEIETQELKEGRKIEKLLHSELLKKMH